MSVLNRIDGLGHIVGGLMLMAPFVVFGFEWTGYAVQVAAYGAREHRDYEMKLAREEGYDTHDVRQVHRSLAFWRWSRRDFWAPVIVNGIVTLLIDRARVWLPVLLEMALG